jgi:hypothetical protein
VGSVEPAADLVKKVRQHGGLVVVPFLKRAGDNLRRDLLNRVLGEIR